MFSNILGQESAIAALKTSLRTGNLAQTYLFAGEHSLGKTTTAIALAQALLCLNLPPSMDDSCGRCSACLSIKDGVHPDVRSVKPSGPSRVLRIAQFWPRDGVKDHPADRAILRDLHFAPVSGRRRIFIIESAESMNDDTANSLLKVLEEPPPYALFILTAASTEVVLPTIFSRSQCIRFRPVPEHLIRGALLNRELPTADAAFLAGYAQGRPGTAIRAAASPQLTGGHAEIIEIAAESSRNLPLISAFRIADDLRRTSAKLSESKSKDDESSGRTLLAEACDIVTIWYRDLLVRKSSDFSARPINNDRTAEIDRLASRYTVEELEGAVELIQDTRRYVERNANAQIATESLMLNLLSLGRSAHPS